MRTTKPQNFQGLVLCLNFWVILSTAHFRGITAHARMHRQQHYTAGVTTVAEPGNTELDSETPEEPVRNLADTARVDPLNNFNKYGGGYDITNKHYWSSTVFTGIYGYAIGIVWLICGVSYCGYLLATTYCSASKKRKLKKIPPCPEKQCHLWPVLLGTIFTFLVIAASGIVLGGNSRFHSTAKTVVSILIETADEVSQTIYNTSGAMRGIQYNMEALKEGDEASAFLGFIAPDFLNDTSESLDVQATTIQRQANKNRHKVNRGLKIVYLTTTIIISLNLVALVAVSVSGFLRMHQAFYLFIVPCWILTVLCWWAFGMYFFIDRFTSDSCTAVEDFQRDPTNNSLSSILPCDELLQGKSVLLDVSEEIYNLVNEVNTKISMQQASSLDTVRICNPFSAPPYYYYQPENCPPNAIRIGDIPQVLKMYSCSNGDAETCKGESNSMAAYASSIQNLLNAFPGMESLVYCQLVKDAFTEILFKHCKPLKKYVRMVWTAMLILSIIMVDLVLTWIATAHCVLQHHFTDGSVKPNSGAANMLEFDKTEGTINQLESNVVI